MSGPLDPKTVAFEKWNVEATLLDDGIHHLHAIKHFVAIAETGFREGWEAAKVDSGDLQAAASALIAYLAPHVGSKPLYGADFAAVWYPMQAALLKAGAK